MSENLRFDKSTNTLSVTDVEGVDYLIGGRVIHDDVKLTKTTTVRARPQPGFTFPDDVETEWTFEVNEELVEQERAEAVEAAKSQESEPEKPAKAADPVQTRVDADQTAPRGSTTTPSPGTSATSAGAPGGGLNP